FPYLPEKSVPNPSKFDESSDEIALKRNPDGAAVVGIGAFLIPRDDVRRDVVIVILLKPACDRATAQSPGVPAWRRSGPLSIHLRPSRRGPRRCPAGASRPSCAPRAPPSSAPCRRPLRAD